MLRLYTQSKAISTIQTDKHSTLLLERKGLSVVIPGGRLLQISQPTATKVQEDMRKNINKK